MAKHSPARRRFDRLVGYRLETAAVSLFTGLLRNLPLGRASALGGKLAGAIGPRLAASRKAARNLSRALPELDEATRARVLAEAWENFGRTMAEYVHLPTLKTEWKGRVEMVGEEYLAALAQDGRPGIAVTGHFGNWELAALACALQGLELTFVFREPNNPHVAKRLADARSVLGGDMVPKGKAAAKGLIVAMRKGGHVGLLVDQKLNEGISIPFLGQEAMTGTVMADLALRFEAPVVPIRVTRLRDANGRFTARFRVQAFPPLEFRRTGDARADTEATMRQVNDLLGDWVRDDPGQWLWQHRRWKD